MNKKSNMKLFLKHKETAYDVFINSAFTRWTVNLAVWECLFISWGKWNGQLWEMEYITS